MGRPTFAAALTDVRAKGRTSRLAAAERLASPPEGKHAEAEEGLAILADDLDAAVREHALRGLGYLDAESQLPLILARFEDGVPSVRQVAIITAGHLGGPVAEHAIREALESRHADVRFQAVMGVASLALPDATQVIAPLLADADAEVRAHAAEALGKLGDRGAADALAAMLDDDEAEPRREAALALASLGDPRGVTQLRQALEDPETAIAAAMALGELEADEAREDLAAIAGRFMLSPLMRAAVGGALSRLSDPRGTTALRAALRALRSDGRGLAAETIGELRIVELAEDLAALSIRPRGTDPVVIAIALGRLAEKSAVARKALEAMASAAQDEEAAQAARDAQAALETSET